MIDTHAHLFYLKKPLSDVVATAKAAGVTHIINIGVNIQTSQQAINQALTYPDFISATCGIHPCDISKKPDWEALIKLIKHEKVVALGEIGLDYHHMRSSKDIQIKAFEKQLELAETYKLPVVIHSRKADDDVRSIINACPKIKKVLHCYASSAEYAESVLNENTFFSFTGMITYAKKGKTMNAIKAIPIEHIMIETDCPYLKPKNSDIEENEPAYIGAVLEKIAEVKQVLVGDLAPIIEQTSRGFFHEFN